MFPLGAVLLPGESLPLQVFEPRYLSLVDHCTAAPDRMRFGVVLIARGHEVGGGDERTGVATVARIVSVRPASGARVLLGCVGEERILVEHWLPDAPYPRARVRGWPDDPSEPAGAQLAALSTLLANLTSVAAALARAGGRSAPRFPTWDSLTGDASRRSFDLAGMLPLGEIDRFRVLNAPGPATRLAVIVEALGDVVAALRFRLADPDLGDPDLGGPDLGDTESAP